MQLFLKYRENKTLNYTDVLIFSFWNLKLSLLVMKFQAQVYVYIVKKVCSNLSWFNFIACNDYSVVNNQCVKYCWIISTRWCFEVLPIWCRAEICFGCVFFLPFWMSKIRVYVIQKPICAEPCFLLPALIVIIS